MSAKVNKTLTAVRVQTIQVRSSDIELEVVEHTGKGFQVVQHP
jgi:hypothetical protein